MGKCDQGLKRERFDRKKRITKAIRLGKHDPTSTTYKYINKAILYTLCLSEKPELS